MEFIETEKVKPGNDVSMSKFKDFFGLLSYDKDFKLMEGERVQKDGTIIVEDSQITPEFLEKMKKDNLTVITVEEFYNKIPR